MSNRFYFTLMGICLIGIFFLFAQNARHRAAVLFLIYLLRPFPPLRERLFF